METSERKPEQSDSGHSPQGPVRLECSVKGNADLMITMAQLATELNRLGIPASFRAERVPQHE